MLTPSRASTETVDGVANRVGPRRGAIAQVAEGRLVVAAEFVTPAVVAAMARHARGLICLALEEERCDELALPPLPRPSRWSRTPPERVSRPVRRAGRTPRAL